MYVYILIQCFFVIVLGVSEGARIAKHGIEKNFSTSAKHRNGRPANILDDFDTCAIWQKIHYFYTVKKEVPIIDKILVQLKEDMGYNGSRAHLQKLLKMIRFQYKMQDKPASFIRKTYDCIQKRKIFEVNYGK